MADLGIQAESCACAWEFFLSFCLKVQAYLRGETARNWTTNSVAEAQL